MSKSRGNVINPDDIVNEYGADTLRMYEMFMGPLEATKPWNTNGVEALTASSAVYGACSSVMMERSIQKLPMAKAAKRSSVYGIAQSRRLQRIMITSVSIRRSAVDDLCK